MKEATGELSMTAVAAVAIVLVGSLVGTLVVPNMKKGLERKTLCAAAYDCTICDASGNMKCKVDKDDSSSATGYTTMTDYSCPCTK